ncbi:MAG: hypothetical protein GXO29_00265 [Thermotogae bacterium]|nr:hypothetical protein [Thermotogota bacterium]
MRYVLLAVLAGSLWLGGCATSRDAKKFEERLIKLEKEVKTLRSEVLEAKGEISSAVGKVKALEENYRILLKELEKIKGKKRK